MSAICVIRSGAQARLLIDGQEVDWVQSVEFERLDPQLLRDYRRYRLTIVLESDDVHLSTAPVLPA